MATVAGVIPFEISDRVVVETALGTLAPAGTRGVVVAVYQLPGQTTWNVTVRVPDDVYGNFDFNLVATSVVHEEDYVAVP